MTRAQLSQLSVLLSRVRNAAKAQGKKLELAKFLGKPPPRVSEWLSETVAPGGEITLLMLNWVTAEEANQQKTLGSVSSTAKGHKTRKLKSYHEKSPRVRKKE